MKVGDALAREEDGRMPCDTKTREQLEQEAHERAMRALEERLRNLEATIVREGDTVSIEGWEERGDWCDECAVNRLLQSDDWELRAKVQEAIGVEQTAGLTFGHGH
jgi:predicted metal-binding protein